MTVFGRKCGLSRHRLKINRPRSSVFRKYRAGNCILHEIGPERKDVKMTFISIRELREGMVLDRDVYLFDSRTSKVAMLRSGGVLSQSYIDKMEEIGVAGVYVHTGEDDELFEGHRPRSNIQYALKQDTLNSIRTTYDMINRATAEKIHVSSIDQTIDVTRHLVDTLLQDTRIMLNIADLRLYDDFIYNHSLGVTIISIAIGLSLSLRRGELYDLALSALLHDIGKMAIPVEILSKPTRLTTEEFQIVKQHAFFGARFLMENNLVSRKICDGVLHHHERYDGTGYPSGLAGDDIPLFARIISVADVYDALTSVRPYRDPSTAPEAIEYVMGGSGKLFDIGVVKAFLKKISPYPVGSCVKLSNGKIAIVIKQNEDNPLRPVIQLFEQTRKTMDLYYERGMQNIVIKQICNVETDKVVS